MLKSFKIDVTEKGNRNYPKQHTTTLKKKNNYIFTRYKMLFLEGHQYQNKHNHH